MINTEENTIGQSENSDLEEISNVFTEIPSGLLGGLKGDFRETGIEPSIVLNYHEDVDIQIRFYYDDQGEYYYESSLLTERDVKEGFVGISLGMLFHVIKSSINNIEGFAVIGEKVGKEFIMKFKFSTSLGQLQFPIALNNIRANFKTGVVYDKRMLLHQTEGQEEENFGNSNFHPERPKRISAVYEHLQKKGLLQRCKPIPSRKAFTDELLLCHSQKHIDGIRNHISSGGSISFNFDEDVYISDQFSAVAELACGCVCEIVEQVIQGKIDNGVAVVRSPGHHAEYDKAMGFCFYSNVAIAAKMAQKKYGLERILVVDWDVHHGNGTQHALQNNKNILFFSTHRGTNFYPYTGEVDDIGFEEAKGYTVNCPFDGPFGDGEIIAAFQQVLMPIATSFNPQLVIVSAGFDAVDGDAFGRCTVQPETFGYLTHMLKGLASGKIVLALEGGYNLQQTAKSFGFCLEVLLGENVPPLPTVSDDSIAGISQIEQVKIIHAPYWKTSFPFYLQSSSMPNPKQDRYAALATMSSDSEDEDFNPESPESSSGKRKRDSEGFPEPKRLRTEEDFTEEIVQRGLSFAYSQDFENAWKCFKTAADAKHKSGLFFLGECYFHGLHVQKDIDQAIELYEASAVRGCSDAMQSLGFIFMEGVAVPKDPTKAKMWLEKSAKLSNAKAYHYLGLAYYDGLLDRTDVHESKKCFEKAIELGYKEAMVSLAITLLHKSNPYYNPKRAFQLMKTCADGGYIRAQYNVGILLLSKKYGLKQDHKLAKTYLELAAQSGHEGAMKKLLSIQ